MKKNIINALIAASLISLGSCGDDEATITTDDNSQKPDRVVIENSDEKTPSGDINGNGGSTTTPGENLIPEITKDESEALKFEEALYQMEMKIFEAMQRGEKEVDVTIEHIWLPSEFGKLNDMLGFYMGEDEEKGILVNLTIAKHEKLTFIPNYALTGCHALKSVVLPDNIVSIGENAFEDCVNLEKINIPDGVTYLGKSAFLYCESLKSLKVPASATQWGEYLFRSCKSLEEINIPNGVKIVDLCFCSSLKSIVIPEGVKELYLRDCSSLKSIVIPEGVKELNLSGCSISTIKIPNSVTSIGEGAFCNCTNLASTIIPSSVKSIGHSAFCGCANLTSITIPNSVKSIGDYAFAHCYSLTSITIPSSVASIGSGAFYDCSNLTSITIPSSVTSIGSGALGGCTNLTEIKFEGTLPEIDYLGIDYEKTTIKVPNKYLSQYKEKFDEWYGNTDFIVGY